MEPPEERVGSGINGRRKMTNEFHRIIPEIRKKKVFAAIIVCILFGPRRGC